MLPVPTGTLRDSAREGAKETRPELMRAAEIEPAMMCK